MKLFQTIIFTLGIVGAVNAADHSTGNLSILFMIAAILLLVLAAANIFYHPNKN